MNSYAYSALYNPPGKLRADFDYVNNTLYERLYSQLKSSANLAVDLVEYQQTIDMVATRLGTIASAYSSLKKGNLSAFRKALGVNKDRDKTRFRGKSRSRPKQAANVWLEYHFGWVPLLQDIHDGCQVLSKPTYYGKFFKASASGHFEADYGDIQYYYSKKMRASAYVSVSNLNLFTANQLGFINPAAVAWELVPFSFVVDWFIPVGNYLNSFSDNVGLSFKDQQCSIVLDISSHATIDFGSGVVLWYSGNAGRFDRSLAWPSYALTIPSRLKAFSLSRAATAISLVLQQLRS